MPSFDEIVHVHHLERFELEAWIEQRWVKPAKTGEGYAFDEADEARIALIRELRDAFMVNDDALAVVLSLLDQLYATRRVLHRMDAAVEALPEPLRGQLRAHLRVDEPG
ncbi:MAG: chaperone modulator CbpM [Rhodospirillales bacterium]